MLRRLPVLALLLAVCATPVAAESLPSDAVHIVSPRPGGVLRAGDELTLEWRARDRSTRFEEWEAFLSLDDGATWTARLTPHLDRRLNRVEVTLPDIPSRHARLLLRFGDERHELEYLAPFELVVAPRSSWLPAAPARLAPARGEAARPGGGGVTEWVDGPRDGSAFVHYRAPERSGFAPIVAPAVDRSAAATLDERSPSAGAALLRKVVPRFADEVAPISFPASSLLDRAGVDRLALHGRRNE